MLRSIKAIAFALGMLCPLGVARAEDAAAPYVEVVDPREDMRKLDDQVIAKQRELLQARRAHDDAAVQRLEKEFKELQSQRSKLVPEVQKYR